MSARAKLIIQVPSRPEAQPLSEVLAALPGAAHGVGTVETLVVSDGDAGFQAGAARAAGVTHLLELKSSRGAVHALQTGLLEAARLGADYVVVVEASSRCDLAEIPRALASVVAGEADVAVAEADEDGRDPLSMLDRAVRGAGVWITRRLSGSDVGAAPFGYWAFNRRAMLRLGATSRFAHNTEMLFVARDAGLRVLSVSVSLNPDISRAGEAMRSAWSSAGRSAGSLIKLSLRYRTSGILAMVGGVGLSAGAGLAAAAALGAVSSAVPGAAALASSVAVLACSAVAAAIEHNRRLLRETLAEISAERLVSSEQFRLLAKPPARARHASRARRGAGRGVASRRASGERRAGR